MAKYETAWSQAEQKTDDATDITQGYRDPAFIL